MTVFVTFLQLRKKEKIEEAEAEKEKQRREEEEEVCFIRCVLVLNLISCLLSLIACVRDLAW